MKNIIIVGAGGFGRELLQWIKDINAVQGTWNIKGFIDDDLHTLDKLNCDYRILSTIKDYVVDSDSVLALGIADPHMKENVTKSLLEKGCEFASIIHPSAKIGELNQIGKGFIAYPKALVTTNVFIGDFVTLLSSNVGHDAVIDDYCTISSWCDVTGGVHLAERVYLASGVKIIPRCTIGADSYLCAGSVVFNNVKPCSKMLGNPAKKFEIKRV